MNKKIEKSIKEYEKIIKDLKIKRQINLLKCGLYTFYPYNFKIKDYKDFFIIKIKNHYLSSKANYITYKVNINKLYKFIAIFLSYEAKRINKKSIDNFINDFLNNKIQLNKFI